MKLTVFEISLIHLVLGAIKHAPIHEVEKILELRKKFKPTDKENELDKEGSDKVHSVDRKIDISEDQRSYIYEKMSNPDLGLPVKEETVKLINKLKPNTEDKK